MLYRAATGAEIAPERVIALLDDPHPPGRGAGPSASAADGPTITTPARARMAKLGVTEGAWSPRPPDHPPGRHRHQRSAAPSMDERSGDATTTRTSVGLSRNQRAVARTVARSAATIPAAYCATRRSTSAPRSTRRPAGRAVRRPVGLAELFVAAIQIRARRSADASPARRRHHRHPSGAAHRRHRRPRRGPLRPVVRDARTPTIAKASPDADQAPGGGGRRRVRQSDLDGANITLTLHLDRT